MLERAEVETLIAACRTDEERALLLTAYDLAFRAGELERLHAGQIDLGARTVTAARSKEGRTAVLGISKRTAAALAPFVRAGARPFEAWNPRRFARWFRRLVDRAGLPSYPGSPEGDPTRPHDVRDKGYSHVLRRSRATHLIEAGAEATDVQRRLGHKSVKTTWLYIGLTEDRKRKVDEMAAGILDG